MWGGVKARVHHGDIFRSWSGTQGLDSLRRKLYREPRPWYLAWSLHHYKHLLSDHHCARLISWCTSVVELERRSEAKRHAYVYTQQVFQFMVHSHKAGHETFQEYFRLCAVGRDLTMAFRWQQYLVETNQSFPMAHYTWLLRIAALSPSDESAGDMAEAVWEIYVTRYCTKMQHETTGDTALSHFVPSTEEEGRQLKELFDAFRALRERIVNAHGPSELVAFIDTLPQKEKDASSNGEATGKSLRESNGWPTCSRHHTFLHLEARASWNPPTLQFPCLRDSLLHEDFVRDLQDAAFAPRSNVQLVVDLLHEYRTRVVAEREGKSAARRMAGERDIWRQFTDLTALAFRQPLIESGELTAELYHYLIVALSSAQPSMALRTLRRMEESQLPVLDLTRLVLIVRCDGSPAAQLELFITHMQEMNRRRRIDEDYDVTREVELYWKYQYVEFLHYRNALSREATYQFLMDGVGPLRLQEMIVDAQIHGSCAAEDVAVLDEAFCSAVARHYRGASGAIAIDAALDTITRHIPKLDISLLGSVQHFGNYALSDEDYIATDVVALKKKLAGHGVIYLLDASFVESSEQFLCLGKNCADRQPLVLVPYCCLQQLAATLADTKQVPSFDEALREASRTEPFIASQRLRGLFALLSSSQGSYFNKSINQMNSERTGSNLSGGSRTAVLHYSECLLAHRAVPPAPLNPAHNDNDHLLLVLAMLRALAPSSADVVFCTDDPYLLARLREDDVRCFFSGEIKALSSEPPRELVLDAEKGVIDDNPAYSMVTSFEPKLNCSFSVANTSHSVSITDVSRDTPQLDAGSVNSAWLDMLDDKDCESGDNNNNGSGIIITEYNKNSSDDLNEKTEAAEGLLEAQHVQLMQTYQSEHDVVPVGVLMAEASSIHSVFDQFDANNPDAHIMENETRTSTSSLRQIGDKRTAQPRRLSSLEREVRQNRGASNRQRYRLARRLSNMAGGRVPFNFRYKIMEVNINDPRSKTYREAYKDGIRKKRESYKRSFERSHIIGRSVE